MTDIHPPHWKAGALVVHKDHVRDMLDLLPPQVEMRVRSIDTNADYRVLPMSVRFERGDGPYQLHDRDLTFVLDWLRENGYPELEDPRETHIRLPAAQVRQNQRMRAGRRVLAELMHHFEEELQQVPLGVALHASMEIVRTVLDEDHDPLRTDQLASRGSRVGRS